MTPVWDLKAQYDAFKGQDVFDCLIAESLLSEGRYMPTFPLALERYNVATIDAVAAKQQERLKSLPKLEELFTTIEMPLASVLWQMEQHGILLDTARLTQLGIEIGAAIEQAEKDIKKEVGYPINLNSSQQMGIFLAEKAGVPLGKTKTGKYATSEPEIAKFKDQFPIIQQVLSYRELAKLRSTR